MKPADGGRDRRPVIAEILRGVEHPASRFAARGWSVALDEFRSAFWTGTDPIARSRSLEALDEESGIGFDAPGNAGAEASPLLAGLPMPSRGSRPRSPGRSSDGALLQLLMRALAEGRTGDRSSSDDD